MMTTQKNKWTDEVEPGPQDLDADSISSVEERAREIAMIEHPETPVVTKQDRESARQELLYEMHLTRLREKQTRTIASLGAAKAVIYAGQPFKAAMKSQSKHAMSKT
ncbi:MAG TPA: hypothetical protein DCZ95_13760 [Verrucomicrobia bacterium]|nr:MAG: hypothetical protein A2X46_02110 [Lentisphaerae bacterium GWF2_57_35]HBA85151.1 hypothetical protein [Verrucomicrobiota bacterium]